MTKKETSRRLKTEKQRYLRATEVGRLPTSSKYELHLRLKSPKNGPVVRNRIRLPYPVKTDLRIAVICDPNSSTAAAARKAGASLVGEEAIFDAVKEGRIEFDRCICHQDSLAKLNKAALGRVLGPKGLMPSAKTGTVVKDVAASVQDMVGASEYRERLGVIRMAIGQLGMAPEELSRNIKSFIENVKKDMAAMSDRISKDIHEVVSLGWSFCMSQACLLTHFPTGSLFNQRTWSQFDWRYQRSGFDTHKGSRNCHVNNTTAESLLVLLFSKFEYCRVPGLISAYKTSMVHQTRTACLDKPLVLD
jgi:ribosomal protein L1